MFVAALWFALHALQASTDSKTPASTDLFSTSSEVTVMSNGMMVTSPQVRMVMMIKRADDGTLVTSCVTSADEAENFLRPKTRTVDAKTPQEK